MEVYLRPDGLRYDPDLIMDPPARQVRAQDVMKPPKVETLSGPRLAFTLLTAQLPMDPKRLSVQKFAKVPKLNSAARRAARIAAGRLKVVDGQLHG